ncbi:MAG: glutamate 5-kinase [Clostridiales bacterium]|nr:glutamate 5-kinase [Clostridiales bacterium]
MGLKKVKRLVVKVGSSTLTYESGKLNHRNMERIVRVLSDIMNSGIEVVLVSSGAQAAGFGRLGLREKPKELRLKQATASVGQGALMYIYEKYFGEYGYPVGQILLNRSDVEEQCRRQNLQNTFEALIEFGAVPIVNENDSVAVEEILIGDNDTLSATVACLVGADLLVILSDIDGLYDSDPRLNPQARFIDRVEDIDSLEASISGAGSNRGTGGMITKIQAARMAVSCGVDTIVTRGDTPELLYDILEGKPVGTLFVAKNCRTGNDVKNG